MTREAKKGGADNTSLELRAVLNSPMQQGGVNMIVQAAPFKGTGAPALPRQRTIPWR
jgi:hypothetical protein